MFTPQLFEAQVRDVPENLAVTFEGESLTYRELDHRTNQLAHRLKALGVGPEVPVGVCMERSIELVVAILGLLKAGGAYLPLDPSQPQERLSFILDNTPAAVILAQQRLLRFLPPHEAHAVCLDSDWNSIADKSSEPLETRLNDGNLAFLIYTSGSTGEPKAVMLPHRERETRVSHENALYQMSTDDRHVLKSSISFTLFSREVFWPLLTGAQLFITPPGTEQDSAYLAKFIAANGISIITLTPSTLGAFLEEPEAKNCPSLRHVVCFGEALTPELRRRFFSRLSAELSMYYGATEAPSATLLKCRREDVAVTVQLGQPLPGKEVHLLNGGMEPVPPGVSGELHIGGKLARGYFKRPDLTAERFIPDPFSEEPGARLYRTGDLGRYLPDESIEFLGRADDQVKIRGFRIEPGEIEKVVRQYPGVREAVVAARGEGRDSKRLVAYVASTPQGNTRVGELRRFLTARLPHYMVPSAFVFLDGLPRTTNGKVDRNALPPPERSRPALETPLVAPRTPLEKELAEIWKEVLCLDEVGTQDNFLDLGGDSLLASQIISRVIKRFELDLPVQLLFDSPTIAEMAGVI
ncbi:MAG: non-ribosomal peptide synthetase, partial [Nitrospiraceae bacterium]